MKITSLSLNMCTLGSCSSLYLMVVNQCSLATDGVLAYAHPLPHPLLTMDALVQMAFLGLSEAKLLNEMIILSETQIGRQENGLTFWLFQGKHFCLIKFYINSLGVF